MHGWLFKNIHLVKLEKLTMLANDPLKFNNAINTHLINLIIASHCISSLNVLSTSKLSYSTENSQT